MMEKGNNHYEYIKTLINLYTDLDCYSYGNYQENTICIIKNTNGYIVTNQEHKIKVNTPNDAVYAALEMTGVEYKTNDFERIRDIFLEKNISYVENLLKNENFLNTIPEISKHFDYDSLKIMAIFSIIELGDRTMNSKILDNKMQFLIAALLVKKPKDKVIRK